MANALYGKSPNDPVWSTDWDQLINALSGVTDPGALTLSPPIAAPATAPGVTLQAGSVTSAGRTWAAYWISGGSVDGGGAPHRNGVTLLGPATASTAMSSQEAVCTPPGSAPSQAIGWGLCATPAGSGTFYVVAEAFMTTAGAWPSITDNLADASLTTAAPSANTTGTSMTVGAQLAVGGAIDPGAQVTIRNNSFVTDGLHFYDTYIGGRDWAIGSGVGGLGGFGIYDLTAAVMRLFFDSTGTTTFGGPVTLPANQYLTLGGAADPSRLYSDGASVLHILTPGGATTTYDGSANWAFPSLVQFGTPKALMILNPTNSPSQPAPNTPWMRVAGPTSNGIAFNAGAPDGAIWLNGDMAAPTYTTYNTLDDGTGNVTLPGNGGSAGAAHSSGTISLAAWTGSATTGGKLYAAMDGSVHLTTLTGAALWSVDSGGNLTANASVSTPTLQSFVATGTAPLTVASTTLNTNLNADLLHGEAPGNGANQIVQRDANGYLPTGANHVEDPSTDGAALTLSGTSGLVSTTNTTDTTLGTWTATASPTAQFVRVTWGTESSNAASSGYVVCNSVTGATHSGGSPALNTDTFNMSAPASSLSIVAHATAASGDTMEEWLIGTEWSLTAHTNAAKRLALAGGAY